MRGKVTQHKTLPGKVMPGKGKPGKAQRGKKTGGGPGRAVLRFFVRAAQVFLITLLALALVVGAKALQNRRDVVEVPPFEAHLTALLAELGAAGTPGAELIIRDPYAVPGQWYKVQLHAHTDRSIDGRWSVEEALAAYAAAGYHFVALSDHDQVTRPDAVPPGLVVVPAEENTVSFPFWPLGHHAILLFIDEHIRHGSARERFDAALAQGAVVSAAHPNWIGNLGSGRWEMRHLMAAPQITLMEVWNPHSDSRMDTDTWHETAVRRGPGMPVWAVAVDDAHYLAMADQAWTMVKAEAQTLPALREALLRGSLYPSTGPRVEFGAVDGEIVVAPPESSAQPSGEPVPEYAVAFVAASGAVVAEHRGPLPARYRPRGDEGFVRVELVDLATGGRAWSQPFWIMGAGANGLP